MNAMQFLRQGGTQIFDGSMQANSFNQADESDKNQESDDENYGDEGSEDNECDVDDSSCMSSGENDDSRHNNATIDDEDEGEQTISIQPQSEGESCEVGDQINSMHRSMEGPAGSNQQAKRQMKQKNKNIIQGPSGDSSLLSKDSFIRFLNNSRDMESCAFSH